MRVLLFLGGARINTSTCLSFTQYNSLSLQGHGTDQVTVEGHRFTDGDPNDQLRFLGPRILLFCVQKFQPGLLLAMLFFPAQNKYLPLPNNVFKNSFPPCSSKGLHLRQILSITICSRTVLNEFS